MWSIRNKAATFAIAGALAVSSITAAVAAPVPTGTAALKAAQSSNITDVRWRHGGGAVVAGLAAGIIGAAAANAFAPDYYYGAPYGYYGYPAYGYGGGYYRRPYYHHYYGHRHYRHHGARYGAYRGHGRHSH